ncbi:thymidine phosphorylase, partial [Streptomonospora algeriensis]
RARKEDPVSPGAGVELHAKPGEELRAGRPLFTLHTDDPTRFDRAVGPLSDAFTIDGPQDRLPLVIDRIG